MKININNYEEYFIDYFDGKLSAEDVAELFLFLENEPKLKDEFESFSPVALDAGDEFFPLRDALKRGEINQYNFDWYLAASLEGDLSADEEKQLNYYVQKNQSALRQKQLMDKTRLQPGTEVFVGKSELKQPIPFVLFSRQNFNYAIAAILLLTLVAGSYFVFTRTQNTTEQRMAQIPVEKQIEQVQESTPSAEEKPVLPDPASRQPQANDQLAQEKPAAKKDNNIPEEKKPKDAGSPILETAPLTEEKIQLAETIVPGSIPAKSPEVILEATTQPALAAAPRSAVGEEKYMTVWEALREASVNKIKSNGTGEAEMLASANDENEIKLIDVVGKGLNIISKDKVKLETNYNKEERNSSFKFSAGKLLKIERN